MDAREDLQGRVLSSALAALATSPRLKATSSSTSLSDPTCKTCQLLLQRPCRDGQGLLHWRSRGGTALRPRFLTRMRHLNTLHTAHSKSRSATGRP